MCQKVPLRIKWNLCVNRQKPVLYVKTHYVAALGLTEAGKICVREMIAHRLGLAETGHYCLSLQGAAGDVAISLALNADY